jgi:uncharacterized protein (TIGR00369 family)
MTADAEQIPEGFSRHSRTSPLTTPWEPIYAKTLDGSVVLALRARQAHCNSRSFVHGGLISALADNAMGLSLGQTLRQCDNTSPGLVTISLSLDFLGSAQIGQWLEVVPRVLRAGRSLGFVDCIVSADGEAIARGSATFRILSSE